MKYMLLTWIVIGCASAFAKWSKIDASEFQVTAPPAQGSAADLKDMATLMQLQNERTPEHCARALRQSGATFKSIFQDATMLTPEEFERLKPLMRTVSKTASSISKTFKAQYKRPRPKAENPEIKPCEERAKLTSDYSYPSSHATVSSTIGCVLSRAYPERAEALKQYANTAGELRIIGGFHHPTDVVAGELLGHDICARLLKSKSFVRRLEDVTKGNN